MINTIHDRKPIKVQVAFQGGGAKLYALIAAAEALKNLEDKKYIKVTRIAGSSAGSIAATLFAANVDFPKIRKVFCDLPKQYTDKHIFSKILFKVLLQKKPIFEQRLLEKLLNNFEEIKNIRIGDLSQKIAEKCACSNSLSNRLILTKTSIKYGENCISSKEERVVDSIINSCKIPLFFGDGSIYSDYYDGGITNNLAVNYLLDEAEEYGNVIALSFHRKENETKGFFKIIKSVFFSALEASVEINKSRKRVFSIELDSSAVKGMLDFEKMAEIFKQDITQRDSAYFKNRQITEERIISGFISHNYARKESIRSRLDYLNANIPAINEKRIGEEIKVQYTYSNFKSIENMQQKIDTYLSQHGLWVEESYYPEKSEEYFDAIQRPEIAVMNRAIYLFPFFLSRIRRNYWGVIDYGLHKAIGVILSSQCELAKPKDNTSLNNYIKRKHCFNSTTTNNNLGNSGSHWIDKLVMAINNCVNKQSKLITVSGYLHNEIVPLMLLNSGNSEALNAYTTVCSPVSFYEISSIAEQKINELKDYLQSNHPDGSSYSFNKIEFNNFLLHYIMYERFLINSKHSCIIFDLTYSYLVELLKRYFNSDAEILSVNHYQDIIVGIGFSLPAFQKLENTDLNHWNEIRNIAINELTIDEEKLLKIGIELNRSN
jgi:predicted acylesterase/phospholipase RssA